MGYESRVPDFVTKAQSNARHKNNSSASIGWAAARYLSLKSTLDVFVSLVTLPLWGSVVLILWLTLKASDPMHPAFFCQQRTGLEGRRFKLYKLRTMVPSAATLQKSLSAYNLTTDTPFDFKMANDPRVTRLGRILRSTHLDELPQLINVVLGDMSIVGPRPSSVPASEHKPAWLPRLSVKPGLTGLAQINRAECPTFDTRARLDIEYIHNQSLWLDIWIIWRTLRVALIDRKGL